MRGLPIGKDTGREREQNHDGLVCAKNGRAVSVSAPSTELALDAAKALRSQGFSGVVAEPTLESMRNGIFLVGC